MSKLTIGFIGLGNMGSPMAANLAAAGHTVRGNDVAGTTAEGVTEAKTIAEAVADADVVITMLPNGAILRQVAEEAVAHMAPGALLIDCSTVDVESARFAAEAAQKAGLLFVDAPVSGGQAGAENGVLTVMAGGETSAFEIMEPVIAAYAKHTQRMGDVGSGQVTKMVNQLCIAGILGGLSEAFHFAECAGLNIDEVTRAIQGGAAQSWQMNNRSETIAQRKYDFGFAIDWMRKDLGFALDVAQQLGLHLPIATMVDDHYANVQTNGGGRWDTSGLIEQIRMRTEKTQAAKTAERVTHSGGCHCGSVQWTVEAPKILDTHTCNCSICDINHYQHLLVPESRFNLTKGEESLSLYTFGSHQAKHYFCKHCGVKSFYVPRSNPDGVSVNARCLNLDTVEVIYDKPFDGRNWEKNAGSLAHLSKES